MGVFLNLPVTTTEDIAEAVRAELAVELARLDVASSTRASQTSLTALIAAVGTPAQAAALASLITATGSPAQAAQLATDVAALLAEIDTRATPADVTVTVTNDSYGGRAG